MKRRRYGWGWTPTTWQAWLFIVTQLGIIFVAAFQLPLKPMHPSLEQLLSFFIVVAFVVLSLIIVASQTAPKPHWRWGKKPDDNPNEDF